MQPIVLTIPIRPVSLKNSYQIRWRNSARGKIPFICKSDAAERAMQLAKGYLNQQYRGKLISQAVHLDLKFEYKNTQKVPDIDNAECFVLDALKGIVLEDDRWSIIGELGVSKQHITNAGVDRITIRISVGGEV